MEKKIIGYLAVDQDAHIDDSAAGGIAAGRDLIAKNSINQVGVVGRDLFLKNGFSGVLITGNQAHVENSTIGILLGKGGASLQDSKVLFTGAEIAVMGVIAGLLCVIIMKGIKLLRHLFRTRIK